MATAAATTPTALRDDITGEPTAYWLSGQTCEKTDRLWSWLKYAPQTWEVTLTSAEIKALETTGKILVPAPGADKYLEVLSMTFILNYGSEVFVEPSAPDDMQVCYDDAGGVVIADVIGDFIINSADTIAQPQIANIEGSAASSIVNKNIILDNAGNQYTGNASGDSTLTIITTVITRDAGLA